LPPTTFDELPPEPVSLGFYRATAPDGTRFSVQHQEDGWLIQDLQRVVSWDELHRECPGVQVLFVLPAVNQRLGNGSIRKEMKDARRNPSA